MGTALCSLTDHSRQPVLQRADSQERHMTRVILMLILSGVLMVVPAWAQGDPSETRTERPATASYWGDTGLWFVPTAEVVKPGGWSFSLYRTEFDFKQGITDVSDWPLTLAVGAGPRTEIFAAMRVVTRIDRDLQPLFEPGNVEGGGVINDRPFVREAWTGNDLGDLFMGAKFNMLTERRQQPFALALRATVKAPTADLDTGAGTGEWDYFADAVLSKEIARRVEISGFGGYAFRGDPDGLSLADGFRWGLGAAFGARSNLRVTTEVFGEQASDDAVITLPGVVRATDGSTSPVLSRLDTGITTALGLTWQHSSGMSLGAGVTYQFGLDESDALTSDEGHAWGMQFRIGFHNGVRRYVPPAPPRIVETAPQPTPAPPAPEPLPAPVANRPPTIKAQCNPCSVEVGSTSTVRADSQDPDGDKLTYRWATKAGTLVDPRALATNWIAETTPGTVSLTVTAEDGRGGVATDTVNIEVVRPAAPPLVLEDVQFDLDKDTLRPDGIAVLDRVVSGLKQNPGARVRIEGHTSNEASEIYNQNLGGRRAQTVQQYLVSKGIEAARLQTTSVGEANPKYDNAKEETRKLNRRASLVAENESK
jgi:outer membrane protein OmpA-like peptidoglycan-associated protein